MGQEIGNNEVAKLKLKNISKTFDKKKILTDININIEDGEFCVLVGPSGSGKSTVLRIIAGLEAPTAGGIEIEGKTVNNLPPKDRDIAMVFQNYALYPHMSIFENLSFPLKMKKVKNDIIKNMVNETAQMLNLTSHLQKKPKELSGGERQRVALGRAIIRKPKIFLMDEPLSNLDAKLRTYMRAEILKLHKKLSSTVVYVTHDQTEALTMGNKIIVLDSGEIQQIDTPIKTYNNPKNIFVASFIGSPQMNLFDFKILSESLIELSHTKIKVNQASNILLKNNLTNKNLILGIRPENIQFSNNSNISFKASVELIEMLGNEYLIHATSLDLSKKINFSIKTSQEVQLSRNQEFTASFNLDKAHFFCPNSSKRIDT